MRKGLAPEPKKHEVLWPGRGTLHLRELTYDRMHINQNHYRVDSLETDGDHFHVHPKDQRGCRRYLKAELKDPRAKISFEGEWVHQHRIAYSKGSVRRWE